MKIIKVEIINYKEDDFINHLSEMEKETEEETSFLISGVTLFHAIPWKGKYNTVIRNNIYQSAIFDKGMTVLYLKHPQISNLKEFYISILDKLFTDSFESFNPTNQYYYGLHVGGVPYVVAYHDPDSTVNSSLLFLPSLDLLSQDVHPKYSNEDEIMNILSSL